MSQYSKGDARSLDFIELISVFLADPVFFVNRIPLFHLEAPLCSSSWDVLSLAGLLPIGFL